MQPTKDRNCADRARCAVFGSRRTPRDPLLQTLVRSARVEVGDIFAKGGVDVTSSEDDDVVKTLASHGAEEPLAGGVDQRRAYRALDDASAGTDGYAIEVGAELGVSIADDELGALAERSGVAELLRDPGPRGGARGCQLRACGYPSTSFHSRVQRRRQQLHVSGSHVASSSPARTGSKKVLAALVTSSRVSHGS